MDQRHARIAAIVSCLFGGSALAQQSQDRPGGVEPVQQEAAAPAQKEAGTPDEGKAATGANTEESKSAARSLDDVQADGIRLTQLNRDQVMELQRALQEAGYYTAAIDGIVGSRTKQALRQFYGDQAQLAAQGMISARGATALGLDEAEIQRVSGKDQPAAKDEQAAPAKRQRQKQQPPEPEQTKPQPTH